jgi:hypothetical protein
VSEFDLGIESCAENSVEGGGFNPFVSFINTISFIRAGWRVASALDSRYRVR